MSSTPSLIDELNRAAGDDFLVERELGRGGMGAVFLARERDLDRRVAIKVLPPDLATQADLRERFLRETRTAAAFSHPNIVPVHGVEERGGLLLFIMGFVEGETLTSRVGRQGPLGAADATRLLREVAWALSYAHSQGTVHRDIKPDNILLERATGRALVTDFGIASRPLLAAAAAADGRPGATRLTRVGEVVGTPHFMSPEQAAGDVVDGRSDLYALGIVGFFALTGRLPFEGANSQAVLAQQLTQPPPDLAALRPDLPAPLVAAVRCCLAKDPAERFASGEALVEALDALSAGQPDVAPAVRLFDQRARNAMRATLIIGLAMGLVSEMYAQSGADADGFIVEIALVAVLAGVWRGVFSGAGELLRKGFRYEDVRDGVQAIAAEQQDYRAALQALPGDDVRRRRQWWFTGVAFVVGAALQLFTLSVLRRPLADGRYTTPQYGILLSALGLALIALAAVTVITDPRRASPLQRLSVRLWSSPVGRWIFRLGARGVRVRSGATGLIPTAAGEPVALAPATAAVARSPLALFDTLPKARRAELGGVRAAIARLDAEAAALGAREAELDAALAEARAPLLPAGLAADGDSAAARRAALVEDMVRARREAAARRAHLLGALENVRLQLLRVRSGLAGRADVLAELDAAGTGPAT